jgi:hypothetical protein
LNVRIYVEGGGDGNKLHRQCREAFSSLLEKAGFKDRMPRVIASGGRNQAYNDFCTAIKQDKGYVILLVDSEELVNGNTNAWAHLEARDGWQKPNGTEDEQAQLMTTCMETWVMADRAALNIVFSNCLTQGSLLSQTNIESKAKIDVQDSLERATSQCGRDRKYQKGRRSFQAVEQLNPDTLKQHLTHFRRLIATLESKL